MATWTIHGHLSPCMSSQYNFFLHSRSNTGICRSLSEVFPFNTTLLPTIKPQAYFPHDETTLTNLQHADFQTFQTTFCSAVLLRSRLSINAKPKPWNSGLVSVIYISYYSPLQNKNRTKTHFRTEAQPNNEMKSSTCLSRHSPHIVFNLLLHMVSFHSESRALMLTNHNRSPLIRLATRDGCKYILPPHPWNHTSFTYKILAGGKGIY